MRKYLKLSNYIAFFVNKVLTILSPFLKKWEKKFINKYSSQKLKHQPVFIIGAPRTGSTILYQTITNQLDVLYIDNLVCNFHRNLFFGFWLSNKLFGQKAHNCFDSDHGDTKGLHAPSECGAFWYRWLPKDRHFIDYDDITDTMVKEIRDEITAVINYFCKPLIINNNNAGLRIRLLQRAFPNAKFIIADREPLWVAQSLLKARYRFFGTYEKWWSMLPENFKKIQKLNFYKQVVYQHYFINKRMYDDLKNLYEEINYITIEYKNFASDKNIILNQIKELIFYSKDRSFFKDNEIYESKSLKIDNDLKILLENEINKLNWKDYTSELENN